ILTVKQSIRIQELRIALGTNLDTFSDAVHQLADMLFYLNRIKRLCVARHWQPPFWIAFLRSFRSTPHPFQCQLPYDPMHVPLLALTQTRRTGQVSDLPLCYL